MRDRSAFDRSANARCRRTYSALPSGVSMATGSAPHGRMSYGEACMSSSRMSRASSNASRRSSPGTSGPSFIAHL